MPDTPAAERTAEALLNDLQQALLAAARAIPSAIAPEALRYAERTYGAQVTRSGRLLHELVAGSYAWTIFEERKARGTHRPQIHELCRCEPVLQVMRESGELAERERLLRQREASLLALWRGAAEAGENPWPAAEAIHDDYFANVQRVAAVYRPHYETLRTAASGSAAPVAGPRVRSRLFLQPPLMTLLFSACHSNDGEQEYHQGRSVLQVRPSRQDAFPLADSMAVELDAMAWDVAALAVSAFYVRTDGSNSDASFPFLLDDYLQWRGVDPRKRTRELRGRIIDRLELLCSDRIQLRNELDLWLTEPGTRRRKKTTVITEGPFLVKRACFFRRSGTADEAESPPVDGYLLSLGEWARALVAERAMLGVCLRRLAEYDLNRQQWERQIGWYLVFQMNNQASRMTFQHVFKDGKARTLVTPQHSLKMKTVLEHSHVCWEQTARTNPGKVIKQWRDALETLRRDGVIGPYTCLDGSPDGSDLASRGRLTAMLDRRYQFVPGKDLLPHVQAKTKRQRQE